MSRIKIAIRADAALPIGAGHVQRCLTLAAKLDPSTFDVVFLCQRADGDLIWRIEGAGFNVYPLTLHSDFSSYPLETLSLYYDWQQDLRQCLPFLREFQPDWILVDHYGLDHQWQEALTKNLNHSDLRIAVLDDLANRPHQADLLIDSSAANDVSRYSDLNQRDGIILCSPQFALLRDQFQQQVELDWQSPIAVFVSVGGFDDDDICSLIIDALQQLNQTIAVTITVALLSASANSSSLLEREKTSDNLTVLLDNYDLADVIAQHHIAIGAGGASAWERASLGVFSYILSYGPKQDDIARYIETHHAGQFIGDYRQLHRDDLCRLLARSLDTLTRQDYPLLRSQVRQCCDGKGADRVSALLRFVSRNPITLAAISPQDCALLYQWQCEPSARQFFRQTAIPSREDHNNWFSNMMTDQNIEMWLIKIDQDQNAGYVRLDKLEDGRKEVSILLSSHYRGRGLAYFALGLLVLQQLDQPLIANIHKDNIASIKAFQAAGFISYADEWYRLDADSFFSQLI